LQSNIPRCVIARPPIVDLTPIVDPHCAHCGYTDSENNNPNNLRGKPYYCDYRDKFERLKDPATKTWSYTPLGT
jgi:hypothetical protein